MEQESLAQLVSRLSPEPQAAVRQFIEFIERQGARSEKTPFLEAVEEFMAEHRDCFAFSPSDPYGLRLNTCSYW